MHFAFTEEQKLLQQSVEKFIENDYSFARRTEYSNSDEGYSRDVWAKFSDLGWLGVGIPEEDGGYEGGAVETSIIIEALGFGLAIEPFISSVVMAGELLRCTEVSAQKALLPAIAGGATRVAFALAERHSRYDLARVEVSAQTVGHEEWTLNGEKSVAFNADTADKLLITARTSGDPSQATGITNFLVDANAPGIRIRSYPTVDGRRAAEVTMTNVGAGSDTVVGAVGEGYPLIERVVDAGTVALCAEAVGIMKRMYQSTLEYMRGREQFGQHLASFQALQHRVVDMFVEYELSRSMAYMAAVKLRAPRDERRRAVSSAKVQIGKSGRLVGEESIQLHGGMGMTDEMAISHYFKRLTMIDATFGDTDYHMDYLMDTIEVET